MNLEFKRKLPTLQEIKAMYPIDEQLASKKKATDDALEAIFEGKDSRLVLVIGPCSADREDAVLDYISRLRTVQEKVKDKILIVPRIYTNKPRTTGDGYKGMLHQPDPHASENMLKGLIAIRKLHIKALSETGFSCADEMLYPENHLYLSDVLSYVAVGARSVENQRRFGGYDEFHARRTTPAHVRVHGMGSQLERQSARSRHFTRFGGQKRSDHTQLSLRGFAQTRGFVRTKRTCKSRRHRGHQPF